MTKAPSLPLETLSAAWLAQAAEADRLAAKKDALEVRAAADGTLATEDFQARLEALERALTVLDTSMADTLSAMAGMTATIPTEAAAKLAVVIAIFQHEEGLEHQFVVAAAREALELLTRPRR